MARALPLKELAKCNDFGDNPTYLIQTEFQTELSIHQDPQNLQNIGVLFGEDLEFWVLS